MSRDYFYKFPRLDGGLDLSEAELDLGTGDSPRMENLWWENGGLHSREGQSYITAQRENAVGFAASEPFWDRVFLHISGSLFSLDHSAASGEDGLWPLEEVYSGVPYDRGTFFRYGDHLYYKNRGGFFRIAYTLEGEALFTVQKVEDLAYTPVTLLNADPESGSGDLYQPENRLTGRKTVKYKAACREERVVKTGDGTSRIFALGDYKNGVRIFTTTAVTEWPVYVYRYAELIKQSFCFALDSLTGDYAPVAVFGAGDLSGANKAYLLKRRSGLDLRYLPPSGTEIGIHMGVDGYMDLTGLRKTTRLDFSAFDQGIFTETLDGGETVTYTVEFGEVDGERLPVKLTDPAGHVTAIQWKEGG